MGTQKLYQISFSSADAKVALKTLIPAMESGFNVNTHRGDFSVSGEDAAAVAEFLAERIKARLAAEKQAAKGKEQPAVVTREQARFMGFNTDTALGKYTAIVKLEEGMSDRDARSDAISLMRASFGGVSAVRVGDEARLLAEIPEGAWEDKNCSGWGWMAKGHLPEPGAENRLAGFVLVTLENTQTAAFADIGRNSEIKRILLEAAERVWVDGVGAGFALHDANGNAVGRVERVDSVPREPVEVSSGANGRVRVELDLRRDAFQGEAGPNAQIAASITTAAEKIAAAGAEGGFLLNAPDGDVLGGVCVNRLPDGVLEAEKRLNNLGLAIISAAEIAQWNQEKNANGMFERDVVLEGWVEQDGFLTKEFYVRDPDGVEFGLYRKAWFGDYASADFKECLEGYGDYVSADKELFITDADNNEVLVSDQGMEP